MSPIAARLIEDRAESSLVVPADIAGVGEDGGQSGGCLRMGNLRRTDNSTGTRYGYVVKLLQ